jgi:hypothetical protein
MQNKLELVKDQTTYLRRLTDISKEIETLEAQIAFEYDGWSELPLRVATKITILLEEVKNLEHEKKDIMALYKEFNL